MSKEQISYNEDEINDHEFSMNSPSTCFSVAKDSCSRLKYKHGNFLTKLEYVLIERIHLNSAKHKLLSIKNVFCWCVEQKISFRNLNSLCAMMSYEKR